MQEYVATLFTDVLGTDTVRPPVMPEGTLSEPQLTGAVEEINQ